MRSLAGKLFWQGSAQETRGLEQAGRGQHPASVPAASFQHKLHGGLNSQGKSSHALPPL